MLSDNLRKLLEVSARREPTVAGSAALLTLLQLAREVESDHEEARAYHDEIERLHREASAASTAARDEWKRTTAEGGPGEHRKAAELLASYRAEISDVRQEIARYRRLLVASLKRARTNLRRIRTLSIEQGLMTRAHGAAIELSEDVESPTAPDHDPPAIVGGGDGHVRSEPPATAPLRHSSSVKPIGEGNRRCPRTRRPPPTVWARRPRASDRR